MGIDIIGFTLHILGELTIAVAVIRMHSRVLEEHRIDKKVLSSINQEKWITLSGMVLIIVGYILQIPFK